MTAAMCSCGHNEFNHRRENYVPLNCWNCLCMTFRAGARSTNRARSLDSLARLVQEVKAAAADSSNVHGVARRRPVAHRKRDAWRRAYSQPLIARLTAQEAPPTRR